jgi:hypothetical protein
MFGRKRSLKSHFETIHQNPKQFQCKLCTTTFAQRNSLNVHIKSVHEKLKPFQKKLNLTNVKYALSCLKVKVLSNLMLK